MLRLIDTTISQRYISPLDTGEEKTTFLIAPLTSAEMQVINDATVQIKSGSIELKSSLRNRLLVELGLRGWEKGDGEFKTEKRSVLGLPKKDIIAEELFNRIPIDYINDIAERIQLLSLSTGIVEKN